MSLKPVKKSDRDKDWLKKRTDKRMNIYPEYHLIVTEGTKTEPNYFEAIKLRINKKYKNRISLEIRGDGKNTVGLFDDAKEIVERNQKQFSFKHIWVVYDTDDFPKDKIDSVSELCKKNSTSYCRYHAIWSNQCIELWFLLHFGYYQSDLHRDYYFPKLDKWLKSINAGKYEKNREDMFSVLEPYIDDAIKNAVRLQKEQNGDKSPSNSKPGTKVYELIEKLKPYF